MFSICCRLLKHSVDAEDVAQAVFLLLAKKAGGLSPKQIVTGWLIKTTQQVCWRYLKSQNRRQRHEKEAAAMRQTQIDQENNTWNEISPEIDTVLSTLPKRYRDAIELSYYKQCQHKEIAIELDVAVGTVKSRISRGLEMLRKKLSGRGVKITGATLGALLIENVVQAAPAPLVTKLTTIGTLSGTALTTTAATAGISSTSITLMETIMKTMFWAKVKIAATIITAVAAVSISTPIVMNSIGAEKKENTNQEQVTPAKPPVKQVENKEIPKPVKSQKMIEVTPRTSNAWKVFKKFEETGPKVVMIRKNSFLLIPSELRFKSVRGDKLIEAVAKFNNLKIVWNKNKTVAVLYRGTSDKTIEDLRKELASDDEKVRAKAAWKAGWLEDPRAIAALARVANDKSPDVVHYAMKSLYRLGFEPAVVVEGANILPIFEKAIGCRGYRVHCSALEALGQIGGEKAFALIVKALEDEKASVRSKAVHALSEFEGEKAFALIIKALGDRERIVRYAAISTLGKFGGEKAFALLEKMLGNSDKYVRSTAVSALGYIGGEKAFTLIVKALEDNDGFVQGAAVRAFGKIGGEKALLLLKKALNDKDQFVRRSAVYALGEIGDEKALSLLEKTLNDKELYARRSAVYALGKIGDEKALPLLEKALNDKEQYVRRAAVSTLGDIGGEKAIALLEKVLKNKDLNMRSAAIFALGRIGGRKEFMLIQEALKDKESRVRCTAIGALGQIGGKKVLPLLKKAMEDNDRFVRGAVVSSLGLFGGEKALALLGKTLGDKDPNVRREAVRVLGEIGGEKALAHLEKALGDRDRSVRSAAISALSEIDGEKTVLLLEKSLEDRNTGVRHSAVYALGKIDGEKAFVLLEKALKDKSYNVRSMALGSLVRFDKKRAFAHIVEALKDGNLYVRSRAVESLGLFDGKKVFALIEKAMEDEQVAVRIAAISALGATGHKKAFALINETLEDKVFWVRCSAVSALGKIGGEKARDTLIKELTKERNESVSKNILQTLKYGYPGDPLVIEVLKNVPKPSEKTTLVQAKEQLAKSGKIVLEQNDPINKTQTWFGVEKNFVAFFDEKTGKLTTFTKAIADTTDDKLTPTCILPLKEEVWVGTDKGLFCITRKDNSITQYAVNNEIIECKVLKLTQDEGVLKVETDKGVFRYHQTLTKWEKVQ